MDIVYATTTDDLSKSIFPKKCYLVADCNRNTPFSIFKSTKDVFFLLRSERPNVVMSTGAAPGLIGLMLGKILGCRTIWVDSFANSTELSLSGRIAGKFVDVWLTQWQHLTTAKGPHYWGDVL